MKIFLLSTLLMTTIGNNLKAVTFDRDVTEIDRILVLKAGVLDAIKCEDKIYGDHTAEASVYRIVSKTDRGTVLFYEIVDGVDTAKICEEPVTVIRDYFPSVSNFRKLKRIERIINGRKNTLECYLDEQNQLPKKIQEIKYTPQFLDIFQVYGRKESSPVLTNQEINYVIKNELGKDFAKCNKVNYKAESRGELLLHMVDRNAFEEKRNEFLSFSEELGRKIDVLKDLNSESYSEIKKEFQFGHCNLSINSYLHWSGNNWRVYVRIERYLKTMISTSSKVASIQDETPAVAKGMLEKAVQDFDKTNSECFVSQ